MAAAVELVPVAQFAEARARPSGATAGRSRAGRCETPVGTSIGARARSSREALPVQPRRRRAGAGQPVEHDVVEHLVARRARSRGRRRSRSRRRTSRRSTRPGRPANRPGRSRASAAGSTAPSSSRSRRSVVLRSAASAACSASVQVAACPGRAGASGMLRWMPASARRSMLADARRDHRAPVAALGAVAVVAEPRHQLDPGRGDPLDVPAGRGRACRRSRSPAATGTTTWKASGLPPCAVGSVSGPITLRNSTTEPGQPCVITSGSASGVRRADVQEVDVEPVDLGPELRRGVEPRLAAAASRSRRAQ